MATLLIELNNGDNIEIEFNTGGFIQYWKITSQGLLIKRADRSRTVYPWTSVKCYTIYPTNYTGDKDDS